jgi:lipopolysaccharide/colanic/teichoic acid biosynthesis glycosyltransferase
LSNYSAAVATARTDTWKTGKSYQPSLDYIARLTPVSTPVLQQIVERCLAAIALLISFPVMIIVAIIVKLDSPGPILFRQYRVGWGGKLFRFTKFRTYRVDAKEVFPELYDYDIAPERLKQFKFKVPNDPRATRAGRWLRKTTLDELPNFWHVLTGEMGLVGPRPEIPEFLPNYTRDQLRMFTLRPGVTGMAQVYGRGLLTFPRTVAYNLEYLANRSVLLDLKLIVLTVWRVVMSRGAF